MNACVVGGGYVGLSCAVALAAAGHAVTLVEVDAERRAALERGEVPFVEPGLAPGLRRLRITHAIDASAAEVVLLAVPTPADAAAIGPTAVWESAAAIAATARAETIVVVKSTVPPGTALALAARHPRLRFVANPEFLRVGSALADLRAPARVVLGGAPDAVAAVARLWRTVVGEDVPFHATDATSAELAKLASNAMLALRVAFANETADLARALGGDPEAVLAAVGADPRIGPAHLSPSLGFGGPCLPKDVDLWLGAARASPAPVLAAVRAANAARRAHALATIRATGAERVAVWGLGFKPGTAETRASVVGALVDALRADGVHVAAWDPGVCPAPGPAAVVEGADVLVVATDAEVAPEALAPRHRRVLDPGHRLAREDWEAAGFVFLPTGST